MATFDDPLHDEFGTWILGFAPYGGGYDGEVEQLASLVKAGDDDSFFTEFSAWARRLIDEGDAAAAAGHSITPRDRHPPAAACLGVGVHVLYGTPVGPRLVDAFHLQEATFEKYMGLLDVPGEA